MSETENVVGKITPIDTLGVSNEAYASMVVASRIIEVSEGMTALEYLCYELEEFVELGGKLYRLEAKYVDDFEILSRNEDGSINFYVSYYNGGCCLEEALEFLINKDIEEGD